MAIEDIGLMEEQEISTETKVEKRIFLGSVQKKAVEDTAYGIEENDAGQRVGRVRFRWTELKVDREGEVLIPKGVDLKEFKDNPVVSYSHNVFRGSRESVPIGKVDIKTIEITDKWIESDVLIDLWEEWGYLVYNKIIAGALSKVSVGFGFAVRDKEPVLPKQTKPTVVKWTMLELSIVPIPANSGATLIRKEYSMLQDLVAGLPDEELDNPDVKAFAEMIEKADKELLPTIEKFVARECMKRNYHIKSSSLDEDILTAEIDFNVKTWLDMLNQKEGRVISTVNMNKLIKIAGMLAEVIASATPEQKSEKQAGVKPKSKYQIVHLDGTLYKFNS